jgi:putative transposase
MPRLARLDAPGTLHHVMVRGIEGTPIFRDQGDREDFLGHLGRLVGSMQARIAAWVLMDTHVHLLIYSGAAGLPRLMRCLLTGYAIRYNRKYRRQGHLFQNRYKSIVCDEDRYLLELVRYIHLNPLRAGVVGTLEELDRYPWSGHSVLVGRVDRKWQDREGVLRHFGETPKRSVKAYRQFVTEGSGLDPENGLCGGGLIRSVGGWSKVLSLREKKTAVEYDARVLGTGDFVAGLLREAEEKAKRQMHGGERAKQADDLIRQTCEREGIAQRELRMGGQRRKVSEVRERIACILNREFGMSFAEIGRRLGVCASAIGKAIARADGCDPRRKSP